MGCINQNGCLGPKRRKRQVYAQLLDSIHQDALAVQFNNNLNIYNTIQEKLGKKGELKKLLDNLTSHRTKIGECLGYNLRLTTQSNRIESKYAGLIVLNEVVNKLFQEKKNIEVQMKDDRSNMRSGSSKSRLVSDQQTSRKNVNDQRADMHFFWLIVHLLESEGRMYLKILQSVVMFCEGRKTKIASRAQVWRVLDMVIQNLQRGVHPQQSANAYLALIEQVKQSSQEQSNYQKIFLVFVKLWLSKHSQGVIDQASQASLELRYERILRVLVRRSVASATPNTIYRSLFTIYDEERFKGVKVLDTEKLLFRLIQENDLSSSVIRGVFLYMLQYLSFQITKDKSPNWRSSGADQFHLGRYPRITDRNGRLCAFQTLRRWGEKGYLNLQDYISFSSTALVRAYTINLNVEKDFTQQVMRQFLRITEQFKPQLSLNLVSLLMEEIKYQASDESLRQTLIVLVRQMIEARHLLQDPDGQHFQFFISLDQHISRQNKLELIQLMGFIAKQIPSRLLVVKQPSNCPFLVNLCSFLHSVFECMLMNNGKPRHSRKQEDDDILFRYQFANSTISFLKCLMEKGGYPLILSFLASINSRLEQYVSSGKLNSYFMLYMIYEGMHLLNSKQKIPDKMVALNFRLAPSLKGSEIRPELDKVVDNLVGARGELTSTVISNNEAMIQQLRQFTMVSEEEYQQALSYFNDEFRTIKANDLFSGNSMNGNIFFKRQSNQCSVMSSSRGSKMEEDESFKDVMEKIKGI